MRIAGGYGTPLPGSSQFALTLPAQALDHGIRPDTTRRDAEWGERYFHVTDPDGHELSFARPLSAETQTQEVREASG